jgi:hypothetical protein
MAANAARGSPETNSGNSVPHYIYYTKNSECTSILDIQSQCPIILTTQSQCPSKFTVQSHYIEDIEDVCHSFSPPPGWEKTITVQSYHIEDFENVRLLFS